MDVLAYIASDPTVLPLWAAFLFAVGMYPVGLLFACTPCCRPCGNCAEGSIPETITVEISGYVDGPPVDGEPLTSLSVTSCWIGPELEGAHNASAPQGYISRPCGVPGPVEGVVLTSTGQGFAKIGREAPTLAVSGGSGSGATFVPTLDQYFTLCGNVPSWYLASVTATNKGDGYTHNESLTITAAEGDTTIQEATAYIITETEAPEVTAQPPETGTGAVVTATLRLRQRHPWEQDTWELDTVTIVNGGSGYGQDEVIEFSSPDATANGGGFGFINVDQNGAITSVFQLRRGEWWKDNGKIREVLVGWPGEYYRENTSLPAIVATDIIVTVVPNPRSPSIGSGATLEAVIDADPSSPTFGQFTGITIIDGGENYLACELVPSGCCKDFYNGKTVVLKQHPTSNCARYHPWCGTIFANNYIPGLWIEAAVTVLYWGPDEPPTVHISGGECSATLVSETLVPNCNEFSFTARQEGSGVTAVVTPGGEYDEGYWAEHPPETPYVDRPSRCDWCCRGGAVKPPEIEVDVYPDDEEPFTLILQAYTSAYSPHWGWSFLYNPNCNEHETPFIEGLYDNGWVLQVWNDICDSTGCRNCWTKCATRVSLRYGLLGVISFGASGKYLNLCNCHGFFEDTTICDRCEDAIEPMCLPTPDTYELTHVGGCTNGRTKWTVEIK